MESLPELLGAGDLKTAAFKIAEAKKKNKTLMLAMGGHPIKVGLGPQITDLIRKGFISSVSVNGSVLVHDSEVALVGHTSEDVAGSLGKGDFGVTAETGALINKAALNAYETGEGLGHSMGRILSELSPPNAKDSVLITAFKTRIPLTVHLAIGSDVYHIHPMADGAALGASTMDDFHLFARIVATLSDGVFINLGSAVIIPEVFLKAVSLTRNLGFRHDGLTTVNMDFIRQYRPTVNVVERPVKGVGQGINLTGHHEIMFPLLMTMAQEYHAQMESKEGGAKDEGK
jgi:deoxyhypusine synthase